VTVLHRHGFVTCALAPDGAAVDISTLEIGTAAKVAVLLGSERTGLSPAVLSSASHTVRIPMHAGTDSLNVGAAAAIALQMLGPNSR
jgi:tRNA G18 (ribose-2'-O)-methylase SpoU